MNVLTIGSFDCFHHGHRRLIDRAAHYGWLTVGVNSDRFMREYKGAPVEGQEQRMDALAWRFGVGEVALNDGPGIDLIRRLAPDLLVIGSDWHEGGYMAQLDTTAEELARLGVAVLYLPRTAGISTSALRRHAPRVVAA